MDIKIKHRKQMAFDISPDLHKKVKIAAALKNISMNLWLQRAIIEKLSKEKLDFD